MTVVYAWRGFFQPVDNPGAGAAPVFRVAKAGSAVPVKFSLGGNMGQQVLALGYPAYVKTSEGAGSSDDDIEQTVTANASGLQYDPASGRYTCVWMTAKSLAGTCQTLQVKLADGSLHVACFKFK